MAALDESFPRFTKATPAALDRATRNGAELDLYSFRQLEFLSPSALKHRAMEVEHQYQKAGINTPLRIPAHSNEELIHWIMVCQAYFVDSEIKEGTLRQFGALTTMSWMEAAEKRMSTKTKCTPAVQAPYAPDAGQRREGDLRDSKDSIIRDTFSQDLGQGKRHIQQTNHDHFGAQDMEDNRLSQHSRSRDSVTGDPMSRGLRHGRHHVPEPEYDDSGNVIPDGQECAGESRGPLRLGMNPRDEKSKHDDRNSDTRIEGRVTGQMDYVLRSDYHPNACGGVEPGKVGGEGKRHIPVTSSMLNMGTSDDVSGKRNETIPGQGHGMKHVDHFFATPIAEKGEQKKYTTSWRRDPRELAGSSMGV